eukprot:12910329-Prorocentrum_lima.AAC.1
MSGPVLVHHPFPTIIGSRHSGPPSPLAPCVPPRPLVAALFDTCQWQRARGTWCAAGSHLSLGVVLPGFNMLAVRPPS